MQGKSGRGSPQPEEDTWQKRLARGASISIEERKAEVEKGRELLKGLNEVRQIQKKKRLV